MSDNRWNNLYGRVFQDTRYKLYFKSVLRTTTLARGYFQLYWCHLYTNWYHSILLPIFCRFSTAWCSDTLCISSYQPPKSACFQLSEVSDISLLKWKAGTTVQRYGSNQIFNSLIADCVQTQFANSNIRKKLHTKPYTNNCEPYTTNQITLYTISDSGVGSARPWYVVYK